MVDFFVIGMNLMKYYNLGVSPDLYAIGSWWLALLWFGAIGWPIATLLFPRWEDRGYLLAKSIGLLASCYVVWMLASMGIWGYGGGLIAISSVVVGLGGWALKKKLKTERLKINWKLIVAEEMLFLSALTGWSWIKAHEPAINGLEKFMDYGFARSIQRSTYFPPADMWYSGETINYYYFGHLTMASISQISGVSLETGFNLMLATLFALCLVMSFGIGRELLAKFPIRVKTVGALFIAIMVTLAGNLHPIYAFTKGYWGAEDNPPPFWQIWQWPSSKEKITESFNNYWYPNATRFIPYTIHEFPAYSFVVSDIHGHVLSIPIVLLLIALLVQLCDKQKETEMWQAGVYGWVAGMAFMTNALDGPIYIGLFAFLLLILKSQYPIHKFQINFKYLLINYKKPGLTILFAGMVFVVSVLPFLANFKPFVNGVAVNCPPAFLANRQIGPLIFESVSNCQKSPVWMMLILWGFFLYNGLALWHLTKEEVQNKKMLLIWSTISFGLIIFAEFFYFKDIYPQHFRSNTMFKLGYQAFILMSFVSGYTIIRILTQKAKDVFTKAYLLGLVPLLVLVLIYPYFAVRSYFGGLKDYRGLYGLEWVREKYPDYFMAIRWLNKYVAGQPVILEAAGDSYTDNNLVSAFSGLPTVAGWAVHEWLWRGSYDPVAGRAADIAYIYGSGDIVSSRSLLDKYKVEYIVLGDMERNRYPNLDENKISGLARLVFTSGKTSIYQVN